MVILLKKDIILDGICFIKMVSIDPETPKDINAILHNLYLPK